MKTSKEKYKESFLIVKSQFNVDAIEGPLSHYWTSPLKMHNTPRLFRSTGHIKLCAFMDVASEELYRSESVALELKQYRRHAFLNNASKTFLLHPRIVYEIMNVCTWVISFMVIRHSFPMVISRNSRLNTPQSRGNVGNEQQCLSCGYLKKSPSEHIHNLETMLGMNNSVYPVIISINRCLNTPQSRDNVGNEQHCLSCGYLKKSPSERIPNSRQCLEWTTMCLWTSTDWSITVNRVKPAMFWCHAIKWMTIAESQDNAPAYKIIGYLNHIVDAQ